MKLKINNTEGIREINKTKNRQLIIEAGIKVFINKGVAEATVRDIIRSTGLASGTFYNYFPDMNTLFDALINELNQKIVESIQHTRKSTSNLYDYLYGTFKSYFDLISSAQMIQFHIVNQAHIRKSSYQSDLIKVIVKNLNRDLKSDLNIKAFNQKHEFLLLSYMLVGSPPELFLATHTTDINLSSVQLATFLAKLFHKVLME